MEEIKKEKTMKKFEVGRIYFARSLCDYNCIFSYKILRRTQKTATIKTMCGIKRRKIYVWKDVETIHPEGKFSMCPVLKAD